MYKYQCSRHECGTTWTLQEGKLNGFVLTCPICSKGRGVFVSQTKREIDQLKKEAIEEMVININSKSAKTIEEVNLKIEELKKNYSLEIIDKKLESTGKDVICSIKYKIK